MQISSPCLMAAPATTLKRPLNSPCNVHRTRNTCSELESWLKQSMPGRSMRKRSSTGDITVKLRCAAAQSAQRSSSTSTPCSAARSLQSCWRRRVFSATGGHCNISSSASVKKSGIDTISSEPLAGTRLKYGASAPASVEGSATMAARCSRSKLSAAALGSFSPRALVSSMAAARGTSTMDSPSAMSRKATRPRMPWGRPKLTEETSPPRADIQAAKRSQRVASSTSASLPPAPLAAPPPPWRRWHPRAARPPARKPSNAGALREPESMLASHAYR
mmetsp:Transcript_38354/g.81508  ORF Transcript_38354/g.81508 Transcript_38354/m.81508 type:complete len:276 (+) Transcript_38354:2688-3515(+)